MVKYLQYTYIGRNLTEDMQLLTLYLIIILLQKLSCQNFVPSQEILQ